MLLKESPKECIREQLWYTFSGAKRELCNHLGYYSNLLTMFPKDLKIEAQEQVEKDINNSSQMLDIQDESKSKIRNILTVFIRRNMTLRYDSNFCIIARRIIEIINDEEQAFWVFVQLIENILPIDFFFNQDINYNALLYILDKSSSDFMQYLQLNPDANLIFKQHAIQWIQSLLVYKLIEETSLFIWDMLFVEGFLVIYKAIIWFISIMKKELYLLANLIKINELFEKFFSEFSIYSEKLKYNVILENQFINENNLESILQKSSRNNDQFVKSKGEATNQEICHKSWPVCLNNSNIVKQDFVIHQIEHEADYIDDYFFNSIKKDISPVIKEEMLLEDLIIERSKHRCQGYKLTKENSEFNNEEIDQLFYQDKSIIATILGDWEGDSRMSLLMMTEKSITPECYSYISSRSSFSLDETI